MFTNLPNGKKPPIQAKIAITVVTNLNLGCSSSTILLVTDHKSGTAVV